MIIKDVVTLKTLLMSEISRALGRSFVQEEVEMFCIPLVKVMTMVSRCVLVSLQIT
jgi:hypothetical protein